MWGYDTIDLSIVWVWFLGFARISGLLNSLPGIGTDEISPSLRVFAAMALAIPVCLINTEIPTPDGFLEASFTVIVEFALGYILGFIPSIIISGLSLSGQVSAGAMGLAQANMMDPTLGGSVAVIGRMKSLIGTIVFLTLDGHHVLLQAAYGVSVDPGFGRITISPDTAWMLLERFKDSFEFALVIAAPIISTLLVTQFVLALITKFVPQVNIFIVSLPLTILVGLFIINYCIPGIIQHTAEKFTYLEDAALWMMSPSTRASLPQSTP